MIESYLNDDADLNRKVVPEIIRLINEARVNPQSYINRLQDYLSNWKKMDLSHDSDDENEELEVKQTIDHFKKHKIVVPLEQQNSLQTSSKAQLDYILKTGNVSHYGENYEPMRERIQRDVKQKGNYAECFVSDRLTAETIVLSVMMDIGLEDKPNRSILLDNNFKSIGVALTSDFKGTAFCVIHLFGDSKSKITSKFVENELDNCPW